MAGGDGVAGGDGATGRSGRSEATGLPRLAERWTTLDGRRLFYREGGPERAAGEPPPPVMVHVHGFGISGAYLEPTARRLASSYRTIVPDLPGYGRSARPPRTLDIPGLADAVIRVLDTLGVERATLVGNSLGCPVICEAVFRAPDRVDRAVLVSPAGGRANQPLARGVRQLAADGLREPPALLGAAVPDYVRFGPVNTVRLFHAMTRYPTLDRFLALGRPTLAVLGSRDSLLPPRARVEEVARASPPHVSVAVILGAAHAINFSHPGELSHLIRCWMEDRPITDDPDEPGVSRAVVVGRTNVP
jgi:pimeloyl-ACP methyl ester carboxylesterase